MSCNRQKVHTLRQQIPSFECVPGCHDCCGPVTTSPEEMSRLPRKTRVEQDAAMDELNCVHLGPNGCTVYDERPLICRLFGTTEHPAKRQLMRSKIWQIMKCLLLVALRLPKRS